MDRIAVRCEIDKILASRTFARKDQLKKLLEILFENIELQSRLRTDRVIRELWPEEAGAKSPSDVAAAINRLRNALEAYYSGEGDADPVTISLPKRTPDMVGNIREMRWIEAAPRGSLEPDPNPLEAPASAPVETLPLPSAQAVKKTNLRRELPMIAAIALVGVASYFALRFFSEDRRPNAGRMEGATLTIMNAAGEELWHKSFPEGFWLPDDSRKDDYPRSQDRLWFGDLNGDGQTEVLFLYYPSVDPGAHSSTLICYSARGEEKWRWAPGKTLPELDGAPPVFQTAVFRVLPGVHGGPFRIAASSRDIPYYPDQIALISAQGKTLSEYWHSGHLWHMELADLDGDGREEIIATGISNGYRQATLVVLDPDRVYGASAEPERPEVQIQGMGAARERLRLLFPRSDLNQALNVYNEAEGVTVGRDNIQLAVRECAAPENCAIWYEFTKGFQLVSEDVEDQFRSAHKKFYSNRKDDHPFTAEEEREFTKVRCLVGCDTGFVPIRAR